MYLLYCFTFILFHLQNVVAVTSTLTRTPICKAFAKGENIGDVTAKGECIGNVADLKNISKVSSGSSNASGSSSSKEQHNQQYPETERIKGHGKQHGEQFRMTVRMDGGWVFWFTVFLFFCVKILWIFISLFSFFHLI
ncbi:hypothetical protein ACSBR2_023827 [Camellia fascicularis]